MDIRNFTVDKVLEACPVDRQSKFIIKGALLGSKKFTLDGLAFGSWGAYMDKNDVPVVLDWCQKAGIHNLYFFGGQSNLMEVLGEVNKLYDVQMSMVKTKKSEEWGDTVLDVLKVEIKDRRS